jgi:small GTP-binding protein
MPANLPPEYFKAEQKYLSAKTLEERIIATQELIRVTPKHKGTEKLLSNLKRRLAKLKKELQDQKKRRMGGGQRFAVKKEGAAQVALVGAPNSGKSTLLKWLTNANPEIAGYPFTTREPIPGMMPYQDVQIQLVEVPAIVRGSYYGKGLGPQSLGVARNADAIALVVDLSSDPIEQVKTLLEELELAGVKLNEQRGDETLDESVVFRRAIIIGTKADADGVGRRFSDLKIAYGGRFPMLPVSPLKGGDAAQLKEMIFKSLGIIRAYTKRPDEKAAERPLVLHAGSTVMDVAKAVHKDFSQNLKFARVWGSTKFPGQQVPKDYVLSDGDVVELHI